MPCGVCMLLSSCRVRLRTRCVRRNALLGVQQGARVRGASMASRRATTEATAAPDCLFGELERPRMLARWKSRSTSGLLSFLPAKARSSTQGCTRIKARSTAKRHIALGRCRVECAWQGMNTQP
eukprot:6214805-Pleurochrysis_carterae.AAC.4